jgi:uncharacterized phage protein (TIGR02220 family)
MMMDWFRWHHGCATDPKWLVIAKLAKCRRSDVLAVWACLLERASTASDRGSVEDFDTESIGAFLEIEPEQIDRIIEAMHVKGLLEDYRIVHWERRQPKREDPTATERWKRWKEKQTQTNADQRMQTHANNRLEERRGEEIQHGSAIADLSGTTPDDLPKPVDKFGEQANIPTKPARSAKNNGTHVPSLIVQAEQVIEHLNGLTGKRFQTRLPNGKPSFSATLVMARIQDGATVSDLKAVNAIRWRKWAKDDRMREFLRPKTLYAKSNFDSYIAEVGTFGGKDDVGPEGS